MTESTAPQASGSQSLLLAEDLRKSYGPRPALRGLSFSLQAGRILGFLGPNGAGKTTSIRILTTMLEPDAGHFVVDGISSEYPEKIRRKIGVLPENLGFPKQMTAIEYLTYFGQLYGRTTAEARTYGQTLLEEVGLQQRAKSLIGTYSHGMRQRIGIARALVNDPAVVFLDEPTLGLDPRGQQELLALVRRIARERNVGVILCSHALSEIEGVCDDVVILSSGQVVATGSVAEVIGRTRQNALRVQVPTPSVAEAQRLLQAMPNVMQVTPTGETAGWLRVELTAPANGTSAEEYHVNNRILEALIRAEIPILSFGAEGGRLQDVFLHLTEEAIK
ncbi:MAG: transporter ATP-binding protein [candidate division NC10 bacterium]|nr:transporter ATP-binding protein [candidate division NC10 bacterium]